jgi:DNA-binding response OmpR family regulator
MSTKILVVDDEKSLVFHLRRVLQLEFPGAEVDAAFSGEEALSRMADSPYDLIIADYRMPGFDGLELIKGVRYVDSRVPIVLVTGYGSESLRKEAARLGVTRYVDKPFEIADLLEILAGLLSQQRDADE